MHNISEWEQAAAKVPGLRIDIIYLDQGVVTSAYGIVRDNKGRRLPVDYNALGHCYNYRTCSRIPEYDIKFATPPSIKFIVND